MSKDYCNEYYCTNCNATLNFQKGFDPTLSHWRCTECGQILNEDDSTTWVCDNCDAILNHQYGFYDACDYWYCTECGHKNPIGNDYIIDGDVRKCPNCDAILNYQSDYRDYEYDWICTECNAKLHREYSVDDFLIVDGNKRDESPICSNCRTNIENQCEYESWRNDYTCSDCGAELHRDYSFENFKIVEKNAKNTEGLECPNCYAILEYQDNYDANEEEWTCSECGTHLHHNYSEEEYTIIEECEDIPDLYDCDENITYNYDDNSHCEHAILGFNPPFEFPLINVILASVWSIAILLLSIFSSITSNNDSDISYITALFLIVSCVLIRFIVWSKNCLPRIIISSGWIITIISLTVLVIFTDTTKEDMPLIMSFLCLASGCIFIPNVIASKNVIPKLIVTLGLSTVIITTICLLSLFPTNNSDAYGMLLFFAIVALILIFLGLTIKSALTKR